VIDDNFDIQNPGIENPKDDQLSAAIFPRIAELERRVALYEVIQSTCSARVETLGKEAHFDGVPMQTLQADRIDACESKIHKLTTGMQNNLQKITDALESTTLGFLQLCSKLEQRIVALECDLRELKATATQQHDGGSEHSEESPIRSKTGSESSDHMRDEARGEPKAQPIFDGDGNVIAMDITAQNLYWQARAEAE